LDQVALSGAPPAGYSIFVTSAARKQRTFVGTIDLFGLTARHGSEAHHKVQRYDIVAALADSTSPSIEVELVPYAFLLSPDGAAQQNSQPNSVTIQKISVAKI